MPHVTVKLFPGRTKEAKEAFATAVQNAAVEHLGCNASAVTVAAVDVPKEKWDEVYKAEIENNPNLVFPPES